MDAYNIEDKSRVWQTPEKPIYFPLEPYIQVDVFERTIRAPSITTAATENRS